MNAKGEKTLSDDYFYLPPEPEQVDDWLLDYVACNPTKTAGQVWAALCKALRTPLGIVLGARVAEGRIKVLFPEFRR